VGVEISALRFAHLLFDGTFASMSTVATSGVMLTFSLRAAEGARRQLAVELQHEREAKARLDGELNAARAIQMGLLPHRFPGPPDHPGIEIFATLEPARTVGGDLYDVEMLDRQRLFFAIADVSGKGVPAALFMAMTKEVLRGAASKNARSFDVAMDEANDKICATSADLASDGSNMMFVTAFAGVLDLATGTVEFVSAGHDSPYVLGEDGSVTLIAADGGPPLGTVDGFPYPLERHQLRSGDLLVLYTDGITEAENQDGAFYAASRLAAALAVPPPSSAVAAIVGLVREDVARFVQGFEQSDDLTLLALRWTAAKN
jgi:serine phosphatase RsbU (regulator of sigma subunit)